MSIIGSLIKGWEGRGGGEGWGCDLIQRMIAVVGKIIPHGHDSLLLLSRWTLKDGW